MLLSEILERARAMAGVEQVILSVGTEQAAARKLYESLGFAVYGRETHSLKVGDSYADEEWMILRLKR